MESDGPYRVINDETTGVVGPGLCADGEYVNGLEEAGRRCESLNTAYAEGRKAAERRKADGAEKERRRIEDILIYAGRYSESERGLVRLLLTPTNKRAAEEELQRCKNESQNTTK